MTIIHSNNNNNIKIRIIIIIKHILINKCTHLSAAKSFYILSVFCISYFTNILYPDTRVSLQLLALNQVPKYFTQHARHHQTIKKFLRDECSNTFTSHCIRDTHKTGNIMLTQRSRRRCCCQQSSRRPCRRILFARRSRW